VKLERVERLTDRQVSEVRRLVGAATEADRVAPLSEQALLSAGQGRPGTSPTPTSGSVHLLAQVGAHLWGYAHLELDPDGDTATAELVVDPSFRRQGTGTALLHALEASLATRTSQMPRLQLWSHGDLDAARALASRGGYSAMRELWQMRRSLRSDVPALPTVALPEGFSTRHFVVGRDEEAWLRLNALAFVDHPEQGRITREDLDQRIEQEWFDASGLILIEDDRGPAPVLVASHWTKVVPVRNPALTTEGEVYVVAVDPAYQGQGFGRTVTVLGLAHLREKGLTEAVLYVDADNLAAVATYTRLDFARSAVDIMYSHIVHTPM
jgi:mycothiol synthase